MFGDNHQNLGDCISGTIYDVATTLGDGWQMPTSAQFDELITNCTVTYTTQNGVKGWKFTGTNNNSIFLPEAGDFESTNCGGEYGAYWSGTMSGFESAAMGLVLMEEDSWFTSEIPRIYGNTVRPVKVVKPVAVDLDLPSRTLWANMNVGATAPEEYGDYFAWGETEEKDVFSWGNYTHCNGTYDTCKNIGVDIAGTTEYDAATANWGSDWQMPTLEQLNELMDNNNTTSTWTTQNGVNGLLITSKRNGNSIFLPAAGERTDVLDYVGQYGYYWTSTMSQELQNLYYLAYQFCFWTEGIMTNENQGQRYSGQPIRPVRSN